MIEKGNFRASILKHSVNGSGEEAISFLVTYERFIHAEVMTHRWSRNYSSSRAIPYEKMMKWIASDPAGPLHLGRNISGMQSGQEVENAQNMLEEIFSLFKRTVSVCDHMVGLYNPHKEIVNRYTEPWGWITGVMTTGRRQLMNAFSLRCHPMATPNIQRLFVNMARLYRDSKPNRLRNGEWHTPFFEQYVPDSYAPDPKVLEALRWSVARCAWCSYNSPTKDASYEKAIIRHDACVADKHVSPTEHQLMANSFSRGQIIPGFDSYRSMIPGECAEEWDFGLLDTVYKDRDFVVD